MRGLAVFIILTTIFFGGGIYFRYLHKSSESDELTQISEDLWANENETCNYQDFLLEGESYYYPPEKPTIKRAQIAVSGFRELKRGETLYAILAKSKISTQESRKIINSLTKLVSLRELRPRDKYWVKKNHQGKFSQFLLIKEDQNRLPITYAVSKNGQNFLAEKIVPEIEKKLGFHSVLIKRSLFQSFIKLPYGNELMQRIMGIFQWKIAMPSRVYSGDRIEVLVEEKYVNNQFIGYGEVISAKYAGKNKSEFAVLFESSDKVNQGYYNEAGQSLEKELMVFPVHEATATSNKKWRFHPVRKIWIPHNGIDYRGVVGTEFFSIGDGVVKEARYDENVGYMIRIEHAHGIYSEYFHAQKLKEHIKVDFRVKRGEVIGFIGETGRLCTGPHLHLGLYKFQKKRKIFLSLPSLANVLDFMPNLKEEYLVEFEQRKITTLALMAEKKAQKVEIASKVK